MPSPEPLEFSVVIPVWHGGERLRATLQTLAQVDFPPERFEALVVGKRGDEASKRIVAEIAEESAFALRFLECGESRRAPMLNAACRAAGGRVLVFAADDAYFREDWLEGLHAAFSEAGSVGVVGGPDDLEPSRSVFAPAVTCALRSFLGTGGLRGGSGPRVGKYYPKLWNMAVERRVAFEVARKRDGGPPSVFDEGLDVHEEVEFAERVAATGRRLVFAPDVRVGYKRDRTLGLLARRNFEKARASRTLGVHRLSHLAITTFSMCFLAGGAVSLFSPGLRRFFLPVAAGYAVALVAVGVAGAIRTRRLRVGLLVPVILVTIHFARGLGYLSPLKRAASPSVEAR